MNSQIPSCSESGSDVFNPIVSPTFTSNLFLKPSLKPSLKPFPQTFSLNMFLTTLAGVACIDVGVPSGRGAPFSRGGVHQRPRRTLEFDPRRCHSWARRFRLPGGGRRRRAGAQGDDSSSHRRLDRYGDYLRDRARVRRFRGGIKP